MRRAAGVAPTLLDKAIIQIAPQWGANRLRARMRVTAMSGGYRSARTNRRGMQTWSTRAWTADESILPDLATLRERSRDLVRNTPLGAAAVNTVVTNVVGTGLKVLPEVDRDFLGLADEAADALERDLERRFAAWADSMACDVTRTEDFAGLQDLAFRSTLESGDVFAVKRFVERPGERLGFRLQMIEGDRVSTPSGVRDGKVLDNGNTVSGGVERDADGAPVSYHFLDAAAVGATPMGARRWLPMPAFAPSGRRLVMHLFDRRRPGQARGVPYLAPVIEALKELDDYTEAERFAAVVAGLFTVFVKTEAELDGTKTLGTTTEPSADAFATSEDRDVRLRKGLLVELDAGESIETANPGRPNQVFDQFVMAIMQQIAAGLELPAEVILKRFEKSYSASLAALLEAWKFFRSRRRWLAVHLCQPCYEDVIAEEVARGAISAPGFFDDPEIRRAYTRAKWIGPAPGQIDPAKEVDAAAKRIEIGISSRAREAAELTGDDWERTHRQLVKEKRVRSEAGFAAADAAAGGAAPRLPPPPNEDEPEEEDGA